MQCVKLLLSFFVLSARVFVFSLSVYMCASVSLLEGEYFADLGRRRHYRHCFTWKILVRLSSFMLECFVECEIIVFWGGLRAGYCKCLLRSVICGVG